MKTIAFTIVFTLISILGFSQETKGVSITVTIENIKNDSGHVLLGLHTNETFMKTKSIQSVKIEVHDGKITATFENVQPGAYAIMVLHDENDNDRMDFEANGMPSEAYGMSNNQIIYGPPQFDDARFEVTSKNLEFDIALQ